MAEAKREETSSGQAPAEADAAEPPVMREHFIPVTRQALIDRLTRDGLWPHGQAPYAKRFFRYLDFWRRQSYAARVLEMDRAYEPFSPDSDLLTTRRYSTAELADLQRHVVGDMATMLKSANYTRIDPSDVDILLTKETHYGLDLHVDFEAFDELLVFYRGRTSKRDRRRSRAKLFLSHEEIEVPIYQRLFILFKLRPLEEHVSRVMTAKGLARKQAERFVRKLRSSLPGEVRSDRIYMKLFKNIPQSDIEMVFPNTRVRFRMFDKIKLGVTASSGLGMGVAGTASKLLVATNPFALAGALVGLSGVAARQASNFVNQRNRYMVTMAQNLYFHSLGDNRAAIAVLAERAAEEDFKEEILLYSIIAKERVHLDELPEVDMAIEQYLLNTFGIEVDFDVSDALQRLELDRLVERRSDGRLVALQPSVAATHIDQKWDLLLDELPDLAPVVGEELD